MSYYCEAKGSLLKCLAIFVLVIYCVELSESHISELLFEEEDSPAAVASNVNHFIPLSNSHSTTSTTADDNVGLCHMEFQVLKRAVGHCVKIGKTARGCVSLSGYIHPFHPDCM